MRGKRDPGLASLLSSLWGVFYRYFLFWSRGRSIISDYAVHRSRDGKIGGYIHFTRTLVVIPFPPAIPWFGFSQLSTLKTDEALLYITVKKISDIHRSGTTCETGDAKILLVILLHLST